jgi:D-alanyl-D-alanine carboxypeptidase/D-alanyl-D-alanine-endopeptidase (penicillin-binding protein 4)
MKKTTAIVMLVLGGVFLGSPEKALSPGPPVAAGAGLGLRAKSVGSVSGVPSAPPRSVYDLKRRIDTILSRSSLRKVFFSARIVSAETGEAVYERNPDLALIPASNMKIVTSAAGLEYMGRNFSFVTRAGLCGDALVVKGSGDPLLGDKETDARNGRGLEPFIKEITSRFAELAVGSVSDIIVDSSIFDDQRVHPSWPANQLHQKYACEVSGLNYNGNCIDISAANRNGKAVLALTPPTDYIRLTNTLTVWRSRRSWFSVQRTDVPGELVVRGNCRTAAGPYAVAVENPALFFGHLLRNALIQGGVRVGGRVVEGPAPQGCEFRALAESATSIGDCLLRTNKDSLGLAAEALLKRLGAQSNPDGSRGSREGGRMVLSGYLRGLGVEAASS